jgi:hypothetical protein
VPYGIPTHSGRFTRKINISAVIDNRIVYAPSSTDLSVSKIIFYMSAFRYNKDSTHYGDFIDQTIRLSMTALMLIFRVKRPEWVGIP